MEGNTGPVRYLRYKRSWRWNPRKGISNLAMLMMLILVILSVFYFTAKQSQGKSDIIKQIMIKKGDTLWEIALEYFPHTDPRKQVVKIKEINGLQDPTIYPGQRLRLPD